MLRMTLVVLTLAAVAGGQYWTGPFLLTGSGDDVNPSACKEFLAGGLTCMVWQKSDLDCWNIYSSFCNLYNGNGWDQEQRITRDSALDNVNPAVACLNDWQDHPSYWCVWEHREGPVTGSIMASFITFRDSWSPPAVIGRAIHTDGDSAMPGIITIEGTSADTVWVAWRNHDTGGTFVSYVFHVGDSWSRERIAVSAQDLKHARLGRHGNWYGCRPLLVWEQAGDIWCSIYESGAWSVPAEVAPSTAADRAPDVVSGAMGPTYIVWQSDRDGDTAIYITHSDTFSLGQRACDTSGAGRNWSPAGADIVFTTRDYLYCIVAWVTDRNGNSDIYTGAGAQDVYVDLDSADDRSPVVTCMDNLYGSQMAWVLWQSNRGRDWDIYGSFVCNSGMEENRKPQASGSKLGATVVRGVLRLTPASSLKLQASSYLVNEAGRKVMDLMPGPNDVRRLAPGIYFVRRAYGVGREASAITKVVVAR